MLGSTRGWQTSGNEVTSIVQSEADIAINSKPDLQLEVVPIVLNMSFAAETVSQENLVDASEEVHDEKMEDQN